MSKIRKMKIVEMKTKDVIFRLTSGGIEVKSGFIRNKKKIHKSHELSILLCRKRLREQGFKNYKQKRSYYRPLVNAKFSCNYVGTLNTKIQIISKSLSTNSYNSTKPLEDLLQCFHNKIRCPSQTVCRGLQELLC